MGDPIKVRRKFSKPSHPWEGDRIEEEREIFKKYGLANKAEIWKMTAVLKSYKNQAKSLIAKRSNQAQKELDLLFKKLKNLSLIKDDATTDDILGLSINNIMDRRLQTILYKRQLARSVKQSRQFILHGHVMVSGRIIRSPSYMLNVSEEQQISFLPNSSLSNNEHPERIQVQKDIEQEMKDLNLKPESDAKKQTLEAKRDDRKFKKGGKGNRGRPMPNKKFSRQNK